MKQKVQRMIRLAAGKGTRLSPLTDDTPKPLVKVQGIPMVERLLEAAKNADISELYLVTGYKAEQFSYLTKKYPNLTLLYNKDYDTANNLGSIIAASDHLENCYIAEGDLVLYRPELIKSEQSESNYLGKYVAKTDDWCFETKDQVITRIKVGGENCYHMYGISYWTKEDGQKLSACAKEAYDRADGKELYWDEVALKLYPDMFQIKVRPCREGDVIEIDTYEEWLACEKRESQ